MNSELIGKPISVGPYQGTIVGIQEPYYLIDFSNVTLRDFKIFKDEIMFYLTETR